MIELSMEKSQTFITFLKRKKNGKGNEKDSLSAGDKIDSWGESSRKTNDNKTLLTLASKNNYAEAKRGLIEVVRLRKGGECLWKVYILMVTLNQISF